MSDYTVIDTSAITMPSASDHIQQNRTDIYKAIDCTSEHLVTIFVLAYRNIQNTKICVENLLKYTSDIDYELVLIDNGSADDTLDYFNSVEYPYKRILQVTKNIGSPFACRLSLMNFNSRYYVLIPNDVVVSRNWMSNMLTCINSSDDIGFVAPLSTNVSNLQQIARDFKTIEEFQNFAASFNCSDPKKWQQRLRLINIITLLKREVIEAVGYFDFGFIHDFTEDDYSARVRRAGYKLMLCGDTIVHHNHDFRHNERKNPEEFRRSLEYGRNAYRDKYHGIDAWDDINNFWMGDITPQIPRPMTNEKKQILGIDVRCGTPILDVKNRLREFGIFDADLSAFTQMAKYVADLQTICTGIVACDREEFFAHQFPQNYYDYIVVDQPLNRYHEPQQMLEDWFSLLKPGGLLIFSLLNTFGFREYLYCQGQRNLFNRQFAYDIPPEAVQATVKQMGNVLFTKTRSVNLSLNDQKVIENQLPISLSRELRKDALQKLMVEKYFWGIQKNR